VKIVLKTFQVDAVRALLDELDSARREVAKGKAQALSLSSPTGSGKTAIATAVIELILAGDQDREADPEARFLWLSDQPELNEQTRKKMFDTSSVLGSDDLVVIDAGLNQEVLDGGKVYFLNTQKLGRNSNLVRAGDGRDFTLWQTLDATAAQFPDRFYVLIDEAHRGMQEGPERDEANTIIQKFIKGAPELAPIPLIIAISATIERFNEVVARTPRVKRQWEVPIEEVAASGLIKDAINLFHPYTAQAADITLLRNAARTLLDYRGEWAKYAKQNGGPVVKPILVVQVQDGSGKQVSKTNLAKAITATTEELGSASAMTLAHSFQEGGPITVGTTDLRYLAPSDIDEDPDVAVVFFKSSLNTGWDCPRAEVMMSFRSSREVVAIAQLVGRMVRAPLARRIEEDEHLNSVALYLPHYDRKSLKRVIDRLERDPNSLPPIEAREGKEVLTLRRAPRTQEIFRRLESLPSYTIPRSKVTSQVRRLSKLGSLLARYEIDGDAPEKYRRTLVETLITEASARKASPEFRRIVKDSGVIQVRVVEWRYIPGTSEETVELPISTENVNDLFDWAGRQFTEGLHTAFWKARAASGARNHQRTKLEAYALARTKEVIDKLERQAQKQVQRDLKRNAVKIDKLDETARQAFREIRDLAAEPEESSLRYPETLEVTKAEEQFAKHLYVDEDGNFSFKSSSWEAATLAEELRRKDVIGWMRNPDRKPYSICVPYEMGGAYRGCYPDFLVVRRVNRQTVVDIVDPHLLDFEDAWHRAQGLAKYAAKHADQFGRIEMIRIDDGQVDRLDLSDEYQRERVLKVSSNDHLRELFDTK
jgi:type III restriction enzyme